jgi:hypothetical protein
MIFIPLKSEHPARGYGNEPRFYPGIAHFIAMLKKDAPADFRRTYHHLRNEDHGSTKPRTLYEGLEFIFEQPGE